MAYHGYIPFMKHFLSHFKEPKVLEIGVDKGQTTIPILHHLLMTRKTFMFRAIDIVAFKEVNDIIKNFDKLSTQTFVFNVMNSLDYFETSSSDEKYDLVLVDGDHNYYTVSRELDAIKRRINESSIIILDDYSGRYAEKDFFYGEEDSARDVMAATKFVKTEKHGVKIAIDEFVINNPEWKAAILYKGEPIVLYRATSLGMKFL